jgi:hypothetical protein
MTYFDISSGQHPNACNLENLALKVMFGALEYAYGNSFLMEKCHTLVCQIWKQ